MLHADYQHNKLNNMDTKLNSGAIFKNNGKALGDNKPDYKGQIDCDGVKKDIALWVRRSDSGVMYFSVKLSEVWTPTAARDEQPPATDKFTPAPVDKDSTNDLPF